MKKSADEFEKIINSLDGIRRAKAPDDFLSDLMMKVQVLPNQSTRWINWLKVSVAAMLLMALLNGYLVQFGNQEADNIEEFNTEYFSSNTTLIDY